MRLIEEQGGAVYSCQACDKRLIRPSRARAYLQSIQDANAQDGPGWPRDW